MQQMNLARLQDDVGVSASTRHMCAQLYASQSTAHQGRELRRVPTFSRPHVFGVGLSMMQCELLWSVGFEVQSMAPLLAGYEQLVEHLTLSNIADTPLILFDFQSQEPGFPELAAPQLIALLLEQMQSAVLRPAWIIGLTIDLTSALTLEAQIAGCHQILPLPLDELALIHLRQLVLTTVPIPEPEGGADVLPAQCAYRLAAQRVVNAVRAAQRHPWTREDVQLLLGSLTRYPVAQAVAQQISSLQAQHVLRTFGGSRAAKQHLLAIADSWQDRSPLHSEILRRFVEGWDRRTIVASFVTRDLYDDSHVYSCIKDLPERLFTELRIMRE